MVCFKHMHKTARALTISLIVFLLTAYPVSALSILIDSNGSISISQGQVLGDDSDSDKSENEKEDEKEDESEDEVENEESADEKQAEEQKKAAENTRESAKRANERKLEQVKELRNVRASENKRLKVRQDSRGTEVMLENRDEAAGRAAEGMKKLERIEAQDLNIELPADQRFENEVENEIREEIGDRPDGQEDSARLVEVKRERERRTDKVEIKSKIEDDGRTEFELEAGSVKAKLRSAEFTVDPETHEVRIVTSSGQEQLLVHLPDQALERMTELASLREGNNVAESELRVETNAEGRVVYKTKMTETRKVLGFIPVQFHSEVELEDGTSELRLKSADDSAMNRLLRAMSM